MPLEHVCDEDGSDLLYSEFLDLGCHERGDFCRDMTSAKSLKLSQHLAKPGHSFVLVDLCLVPVIVDILVCNDHVTDSLDHPTRLA
jgi:hypothetical protein